MERSHCAAAHTQKETLCVFSIYDLSSVQETTFDFSLAKLEEKEGIERERKGPRNPRHDIPIGRRPSPAAPHAIYPSITRAKSQRESRRARPTPRRRPARLVARLASGDSCPKQQEIPTPPCQRLLSIPARPAASPRSALCSCAAGEGPATAAAFRQAHLRDGPYVGWYTKHGGDLLIRGTNPWN